MYRRVLAPDPLIAYEREPPAHAATRGRTHTHAISATKFLDECWRWRDLCLWAEHGVALHRAAAIRQPNQLRPIAAGRPAGAVLLGLAAAAAVHCTAGRQPAPAAAIYSPRDNQRAIAIPGVRPSAADLAASAGVGAAGDLFWLLPCAYGLGRASSHRLAGYAGARGAGRALGPAVWHHQCAGRWPGRAGRTGRGLGAGAIALSTEYRSAVAAMFWRADRIICVPGVGGRAGPANPAARADGVVSAWVAAAAASRCRVPLLPVQP